MPKPPKPLQWIERYELPSDRETHEGWAIAVIDSKGLLAIVSDFGNYAFHWRDFGADFREFICGVDADYLYSKLTHKPRVYDGEGTFKGISDHILQRRRSGVMASTRARVEYDLLKDHKSEILGGPEGYGEWLGESGLEDKYEMCASRKEPQCEAFCEKVWPYIVQLIRSRASVPILP